MTPEQRARRRERINARKNAYADTVQCANPACGIAFDRTRYQRSRGMKYHSHACSMTVIALKPTREQQVAAGRLGAAVANATVHRQIVARIRADLMAAMAQHPRLSTVWPPDREAFLELIEPIYRRAVDRGYQRGVRWKQQQGS